MSAPTRTLHVIAALPTVGDAIFAAVSRDPGAATAPLSLRPFSGEFALPLRAVGSNGGATAWGLSIPALPWLCDAVDEFNSAGPYTTLNSYGLDDASIAFAKTKVTTEHVDRGANEGGWTAWLLNNGYEIVPAA